MMQSRKASFSFDFIDILEFIGRWWKHLLIIGVIAIIASAVFSGPAFITPKYKAVLTFYPSPRNSISNVLLPEVGQRQKDPLEFGEEEDAEKAMQILQSSALTGRLVRNFDLVNYYGIDTKGNMPQTKLGRELKSNIKFKRTEYLSIDIIVLDRDPVMAAKIANGIAELYDTIKTEIQRQIAGQALKIVENQYKSKETEIINLEKLLEDIGNKGVTNSEEQSKALAEVYYKAKSGGNKALVADLEEDRALLAKYGGTFTALNELLKIEQEKLSDLKAKYDKARIDVETTLPHKFIVSEASVPESKATPVRWIIVVVTTISTVVLAMIILIILEQRKKMRPIAA